MANDKYFKLNEEKDKWHEENDKTWVVFSFEMVARTF